MKKIQFEEWKIIFSLIFFIAGLATRNIIWLSNSFSILSYLIIGYEVIFASIKNILKGELFDESFLMTLATIGAFCIGEIVEANIVMLLFQIGEYLQEQAISKSRNSIESLMELKSDSANIKRNETVVAVPLEEVKIGDQIVVKAGEKIPLDGVVVEGTSMIDTKALTGESVPVFVERESVVLSGCMNLEGIITIQVNKTASESTVSKILELIESSSDKKTKTEKFITRFSKVYTPIVVVLALLIAVIPSLITGDIATWIYRSIIFLVLSCPCALVISIPLGFFYGIGECSKIGLLIKGSTELEELAKMKSIAFDKTGTLTKGTFEVTKIESQIEEKEFLRYVLSLEQHSNHPIAHSILKLKTDVLLNGIDVKEIAGKGMIGKIDGKEVIVGSRNLMMQEKISVPEVQDLGTILFVALEHSYIGYLVIADQLKPNMKETIQKLRSQDISYLGVISGDLEQNVSSIASLLDLDEGYAELLPNEKVKVMESLIQKQQRPFAFVGDGMNDAPVLALADLGISMGGIGSDAAIEVSDIVVMHDDLSKLPIAIKIARKSLSIIHFNIVMAIVVKILVLLLGIIGISSIWFAIFADVGVTLLAILNSFRISRLR